jgi:hypothetical protein
MKPEEIKKRMTNKITVMCAIGFILAAFLVAADEILDIPANVFNAPPTPINWTEIGIEVFFIFVVGTFVVFAISKLDSERKRTEESLRKANRALKTLGECNQILVRASEESDLLLPMTGPVYPKKTLGISSTPFSPLRR